MARLGFADGVRHTEKAVRRVLTVLKGCDLNGYPFVPRQCGPAAWAIYKRLQRKGWAADWTLHVCHPPSPEWRQGDECGVSYHAWLGGHNVIVELATWHAIDETGARYPTHCDVRFARESGGIEPGEIVERMSPLDFREFVESLERKSAA